MFEKQCAAKNESIIQGKAYQNSECEFVEK
jgi:hypothetical protein